MDLPAPERGLEKGEHAGLARATAATGCRSGWRRSCVHPHHGVRAAQERLERGRADARGEDLRQRPLQLVAPVELAVAAEARLGGNQGVLSCLRGRCRALTGACVRW
jgi:hypothetical protein